MTKHEQKEINEIVEKKVNDFSTAEKMIYSVKNLRNCHAMVYEYVIEDTQRIIFALKSYETIVALIDENCAYDFLRMCYGYTATSAQHIAKFIRDYMDIYYSESKIYRYYPIEG